MGRATFSNGVLDGATGGLSRLAGAIGGGQQSYQEGYDQAATTQSKIAQALAQIRELNAQAGAHDATAADTIAKTGVLNNRPGLFEEQVANAAGSDIPTIQGYRSQLRTGQAPLVPMGPPTADGSMGTGSMVLPDATRTKIAGAIQQFLPLLADSGDLKPEDLAKAADTFRTMGLSDRAIADPKLRNAIAGAQAAAGGKALYNTSGDGAVLDQYGGALDTSNPLAGSTIGLRRAQAGEASAKAGLARVQADEAKQGGKGQFDASLGMVIDTRGGTARPVLGPDGKPIGPKIGSGSLNQEQANALTFATRMQAADGILADLAKNGTTQLGMVHRVAGMLPIVGDAAAAATNGTQSAAQQQVEQAQRDFINAVLRRESGAAISSGEFANGAQQYFPQPGDKPEVIKQKSAARARVIQGMLAAVPPNQRTLPALPGAAPAPAGGPIAVDY